MLLFASVYCCSVRPRQIELENEGLIFQRKFITRTDLVLSRLYSATTSSFVFFSLKLAVDQVVMVVPVKFQAIQVVVRSPTHGDPQVEVDIVTMALTCGVSI